MRKDDEQDDVTIPSLVYAQMQDELTRLRAELAEARKDAERLDWLANADIADYGISRVMRDIEDLLLPGGKYFSTLQEAIDAAIAKEKSE